ncbi:MAG: hydroxymethylbilane synthase [Actinomycetota bacterium]|nr:hydroxymethylbilane synthase [Actinomycetota bacterium]
MKRKKIVIGSRESRLALFQTSLVAERLKSDFEVEIVKIKTTGDKILDSALSAIGDKGLFTKEIETALLDGEIDMAVHSMKDLPTELPAGLMIGAILEREDAGDALISKGNLPLAKLPKGAKVATSSLRRRAQLLSLRSDLEVVDIRGNLDTRINKFDGGDLDAVVLAAAALIRMGHKERIAQKFTPDEMLPAVGQGAIGIETRAGDERVYAAIAGLNHPATSVAVLAEQAFLRRLEGGCQIPVGALSSLDDEGLELIGLISDLSGKRLIKGWMIDEEIRPEELGKNLAENLLKQGAGEILKEIRERAPGDKDG